MSQWDEPKKINPTRQISKISQPDESNKIDPTRQIMKILQDDICLCFPPDGIWHKVFFIVGVLGNGGGQARAETHSRLDYAHEV